MREMLPVYNLIKTALLSCRLQRIPRSYKHFFVHITFIKVGKHYNTVFQISITKATKIQQRKLALTGIDGKALTEAREAGISPFLP